MKVNEELKEWVKSILIAVVLALVIRLFFFEVFLVDGYSMHPTLHHQERLVVNKIVYSLREPERGEVIVFEYSPNRDFIKRVIAMEGETIEIIDGDVKVNDDKLLEDYVENSAGDFGPANIPEGHYFVMGDNRANSMDSRDPSVGFISMERIKGKAVFVFWPPTNIRTLRHEAVGDGEL